MMSEKNENYISRQITVYKTDKKLLEFVDKLKIAPVNHYAHIHSFGDIDEDGIKQISCIGLVLQDYSQGKGDNTKRVVANISPDEAEYIYSKVRNGIQEFEFKQEKIFGNPDENDMSKVTKLRIIRASKTADGKIRNYPWYVEIDNGRGKKQQNANGGISIKPNSFKSENKLYININDLDFFKLTVRVSKYISSWEKTVAPHVITQGMQAIAQRLEEKADEKQ